MDYFNKAVKKLLETQNSLLEAGQNFHNFRDILPEDDAFQFDETEIEASCYELMNEIDKLCLRVFESKTKPPERL